MTRLLLLFVLAAFSVSGFAAEKGHVFSMSCKVNALNGAFATPEGRAKAIEGFRRFRVTKLWLESYRHTERVSVERLVEVRDAFRKAGFETCGLITPTQLNTNLQMVCCWSDPHARRRLREEVEKAARVFDTVIMDDFLFAWCGNKNYPCARCESAKAAAGVTDWGAFKRALMFDVCKRDIVEAAKAVNPKAHFIIKFPCWYRNYARDGYDPVPQTELFGECWIGTETRDANPNALQACWIIDWMDRITKGRCGGGWYDPLDSKPEKHVEQARYTILGGARESLLHCYDYMLADDPGSTPFGEKMGGGHACAAALEKEIDGLVRLAELVRGADRGKFEMRADKVSRHLFTKGGRALVAYQNTTDRPAPVAEAGKKPVLSLPADGVYMDGTLAPHGFVLFE